MRKRKNDQGVGGKDLGKKEKREVGERRREWRKKEGVEGNR